MLKIVLSSVAAYLVIGILLSAFCFRKNGFGKMVAALLWPIILPLALIHGCCRKSSCEGVQGFQGPQGLQGVQGFQGPQ